MTVHWEGNPREVPGGEYSRQLESTGTFFLCFIMSITCGASSAAVVLENPGRLHLVRERATSILPRRLALFCTACTTVLRAPLPLRNEDTFGLYMIVQHERLLFDTMIFEHDSSGRGPCFR